MQRRRMRAVFALLLSAVLTIAVPFSASAQTYLTGKRDIKTIGHRGYSAEAPENTLASFRLAGESGIDCAECDISPTKDGKWVIMHDATVDRTTDGTGKVSDFTFEEIRRLKIDKGSNIERYPNEKVPELTEYLDICRQYKMTAVIEIKSQTKVADLEALAGLLYARKECDSFIFISFSRELIKTMKAYMPANLCFLLTKSFGTDTIRFCTENGIDGIDFRYTDVSDATIKKLTDAGLIPVAWTVNDTTKIQHLYEMGVSYITTDCISIEHCNCPCHARTATGRYRALLMRLVWAFTDKHEACKCGDKHYTKK